VSVFCMCWTHVLPAVTRFSRCRRKFANTWISSGGRNELFNSPKVWSFCSHWHSNTLVLRLDSFRNGEEKSEERGGK
jgi:hypothetical protein